MTDQPAARSADTAPPADRPANTAPPADRALDAIADTVVAATGRLAAGIADRPVIVAIDGRSGSGKTSLASLVAGRLCAVVVHMDDLYPGWDGLAAAVPVLTDEVLRPLRSGTPATFRLWDWLAGDHGAEVQVPVASFVVVEGCGSSVGEAGRLADLRVWLDADTGQRRTRGLTRDAGTFDAHWDAWARQEDELFTADQTREHADLAFDTTD